MVDDVALSKTAIIERCLMRIEEEYVGHEGLLESDQTRQDAIILNLQRACEAAIDLAMHVVRTRRLGIPQDSRDAFQMLFSAGLIGQSLADSMKAMIGFRNIAVHQYQDLDMAIVRTILEQRLADFTALTSQLIRAG